MTKRRSRGDGGLHWDEVRQRWIASVTVGYTPAGKRIVRRGSGKTKTEAQKKLREKIRDYEDGLTQAHSNGTVASAMVDLLAYGLGKISDSTKDNYRWLTEKHIISDLGKRKLRDLSAPDVDRWLLAKAKTLSTRSLHLLHSLLNRAVNRAMARDLVKRNVVSLCGIPQGQQGRPSPGRVPKNSAHSLGKTWTWSAKPTTTLPCRHLSRYGIPSALEEIPKPRNRAAPLRCPSAALMPYASTPPHRTMTAYEQAPSGMRMTLSLPPPWAPN